MAFIVLLGASCDRSEPFIGDIAGADTGAFKVYAAGESDLSKGLPKTCILPEEPETKTTSVPMNALASQLLEYGNRGKVLELSGTYRSADVRTGEPITLSGKVLLPKGRKPLRYIVVSHYTIGANSEAPSNVFPLEGVLCDLGYAMIFPDYQGYGVDSKRIHPYLVIDQTAYDVVQMYLAVAKYLQNTEYRPKEDDIYLMGFSQGGAVTMAVQMCMEEVYGLASSIHQVFAGGGPYDVRETYNNFITTNTVNIPPAVPFVIQGMVKGYDMDIDMSQMLQPWIYEKIDEWINSKMYSTDQLRRMMGTTRTSDILTAEGMDPTSDVVAELYKAMSENSVLSYSWVPQAPVYLFHSMNDDVVPFVNASKAKSKWKDANIQYNFGYYGSHVMALLRFIFTVQNWLEEEGE